MLYKSKYSDFKVDFFLGLAVCYIFSIDLKEENEPSLLKHFGKVS